MQLLTVYGDLMAIFEEYKRTRQALRHEPIHSPHEGYAIIKEELEELWAEIKCRNPDQATMRREVVQLGAMALAFLAEVVPVTCGQPEGHWQAEQPQLRAEAESAAMAQDHDRYLQERALAEDEAARDMGEPEF